MALIGYGEDGLTYWGLTERLSDILEKLEGPTPSGPGECLMFFRPSFGRSGGFKSAQFGEFDAILASPRAVYLIESKWNGSGTIRNGAILLEDRQIWRHQFFRWLRHAWPRQEPPTWATFVAGHQAAYADAFLGKPLAP